MENRFKGFIELVQDYEGFELRDAMAYAIDNIMYAAAAGVCIPDENNLYRLTRIRDMFLEIAKEKPE